MKLREIFVCNYEILRLHSTLCCSCAAMTCFITSIMLLFTPLQVMPSVHTILSIVLIIGGFGVLSGVAGIILRRINK